jgi:hypothetical protein
MFAHSNSDDVQSTQWPMWANLLLFTLFFLFSLWFMYETFQYDHQEYVIKVASTIHSDFASHIPLIRSFSQGNNWPPEFPLYPGSPIRYHFLFFAAVGGLEAIGIPLDIALNGLSALGFAFLLMMIFLLAKRLFSWQVAVLSVLFFLFNGTLSYAEFFETVPISFQMFSEIWNLNEFLSFGPWDGGEISAFWNLNIFANQRHLAWGYGLVLLFIYTTVSLVPGWNRQTLLKALGIGALMGLLPLLHQPSAIIFAVFGLIYFLILKGKRLFLFTLGATSLAVFAIEYPFFLTYLTQDAASGIQWKPGYLISESLSFTHFFSYWFQNIGLHLLFIPVGLIFISNRARIVLLPAIIVFALASMFQFAAEMSANHKLINFAMILLQMVSAFGLVSLWQYFRKQATDWPQTLKLVPVAACGLLMTLSGVMDLMVTKNDWFAHIPNERDQITVAWIEENTPQDAVFVNSRYIYHPASLAGRPIFVGWAYFVWSAGYNANERRDILNDFYVGADFEKMCGLMQTHGLDYVTIEEQGNDPDLPPIDFFSFIEQREPDFIYQNSPYAIYSKQTICLS